MRPERQRLAPTISETFPEERTLEMFRRMCFSNYFEINVKKAYDQKIIPRIPIYLSAGQEAISSALSLVFQRPALFAQHRSHDIYLAFGGDPIRLIDELLGRSSGCAEGMGGSASIHCPEINMIGHDGLMGTQVADAVGSALATKETTIAFMGDASAEEGFVLGPLGFAATKALPVLFVVCDNGLSILTRKEIRRSWGIAEHANFGMSAVDIIDDPWVIISQAEALRDKLPALMNIHTCRKLWHAGTGSDGEPSWDRLELVRKELARLGLDKKARTIEEGIAENVSRLWTDRIKNDLSEKIPAKKYFVINDPNYEYERNPVLVPERTELRETIRRLTIDMLKNRNGLAMGQCLTAVGRVAKTVPDMRENEGLIELSMDDTGGPGIAVGCSRIRPTMYIVRYQGFQWFNAAFLVNLAAKSKEMWGVPRRLFIRSIAMEGSIGPVASNSHHGMFVRMPGIVVAAPMTSGEYLQVVNYFNTHDDPIYVSEHRQSFGIDYEMLDMIYPEADITLFPISAARLNAIEAAKLLNEIGIVCNIVHLMWLKPFHVSPLIKTALSQSRCGGIVIDTDFENGASKCIALDIIEQTSARISVLGLEERTAGFASHLDNLPPSSEKIMEKVKSIVKKRRVSW